MSPLCRDIGGLGFSSCLATRSLNGFDVQQMAPDLDLVEGAVQDRTIHQLMAQPNGRGFLEARCDCGLKLMRGHQNLDVRGKPSFFAESHTLDHVMDARKRADVIEALGQIFGRLIVHLEFDHTHLPMRESAVKRLCRIAAGIVEAKNPQAIADAGHRF
jgi:hypothetical protein